MDTVRKANVVLLYLRRNGYSETERIVRIILAMANNHPDDRYNVEIWLQNNWIFCIESLIKRTEFLWEGTDRYFIHQGFDQLHKLLAVLPEDW